MIKARIDTDSIGITGDRIVTWVLTYPRYVHADLMTHRVFSRNGASSRAIPMSQTLRAVMKDPVIPIIWGGNGKGMQATGELSGLRRFMARFIWLAARWPALISVWLLMKIGLHKQWSNRILEPWIWMTVVLTTTEHDNFLDLRDTPFAQPDIAELASQMRRELAASSPVRLEEGEWHIPLLSDSERDALMATYVITRKMDDKSVRDEMVEQMLCAGTARAARVSYVRHEMVRSYEEDKAMHDRLRDSKHWSPFEHCAMALPSSEWVGNFRGWKQYRKTFIGESGSRRA